MKTKLIPVLLCCLSALSFKAAADGNEHHGGWCDHNGNPIEGNEGFNARVILAPTDSAPTNASGTAKIEAENEEGTVTASLVVKVHGLPAGDYSVGISKASDGSAVTLGQVTVTSCANLGADGDQDNGDNNGEDNGDNNDDQDNENQGSGGDDGSSTDHQGDGSSDCTFGRAVIALPSDLDPTDIAQVGVVDANGNIVLAGDVTNTAAVMQFSGTVRVKPGPGAPHAGGTAAAQSTVARGHGASHFSLHATGVPPNATFNLFVNGSYLGKARSGPRGRVILQNVATRHMRIRSVTLGDGHRRVVAAANF